MHEHKGSDEASDEAAESAGADVGAGRPARGRSGFTSSDGVRIHYLRYGERGRDVLIVPGLSCPAATYETVSLALAEDFRVVCVDLRGRGLSDRPPTGYTLPDFARDLKAVVDDCGLERPIVIGHALGARIVPAFDALYPGLAGVLTIVDPPATGPGHLPYATPWESFERQLAEAAEGITADDVLRHFPLWDVEAAELRAAWLDTCAPHAIEASYRNFQREDFFGYVARARTPGMFMLGENTHAVPPEALAEIRASNPALEVVVVAATGHMIPFENLPAFLAETRRFIAASEASGLLGAPAHGRPGSGRGD